MAHTNRVGDLPIALIPRHQSTPVQLRLPTIMKEYVTSEVSSSVFDHDCYKIYPPGLSQLFHGTAPPQVSPETYTYLIHALLSMQGAVPPPSVPSQSVSYPQGLFPGPSAPSVAPHALHQVTHLHTPPAPSSGPPSHFTSTNTPAIATQHSASFHADAPSDAGDSADESTIVAEDKRRRNTSASGLYSSNCRTLQL